jgi:hypothetical protein
MIRKIGMAAAAVLLSAGMSIASVTKFTDWSKSPDEAGDVDGVATLKFVPETSVLHYTVVLHNLTPNHIYTVLAGSLSGDGVVGDATSNPAGNLTFTGDAALLNFQGTDGYVVLVDAATLDIRASSLSNP